MGRLVKYLFGVAFLGLLGALWYFTASRFSQCAPWQDPALLAMQQLAPTEGSMEELLMLMTSSLLKNVEEAKPSERHLDTWTVLSQSTCHKDIETIARLRNALHIGG